MAASNNKRSGRKLPPAGVAEIPGIVTPFAELTPTSDDTTPAIALPTPVEPAIPPVLAATVKPSPKPVRAKPAPRPKPVAESVAAPVEVPAPVESAPLAFAVEPVADAVQPVIAATEEVATATAARVEEVADQAVAQVEAVTDTIITAAEEAVVPADAAASAPNTPQEKTIMDTVQNVADKSQAAFAEANERAKGALEKGTRFFQEITEFGKGNVEAVVESSKIAAKGFESLGQDTAAYLKSSFEDASQALRTLSTIKSPTELLKFQADYIRSSFDALVAQTSRGTEASLKLAGEVAQPISNRVAVAAEKIKVAA